MGTQVRKNIAQAILKGINYELIARLSNVTVDQVKEVADEL